jgi:glycosyltransferase involved in cell wall biosynthesis
MKKILHITLSASIGGGAEHIYQLLRHSGVHYGGSYVATPIEDPYYTRFVKLVGPERICKVPSRSFSVRSFIALFLYIKKNKIDIVHSHGKGAGLYGRLLAFCAGVSSIHTFHGIHLQYHKSILWMYVLLEKVLGWITHAAICVSHGERDKAVKLGFVPSSKVHVVENGVEIPSQLAPHSVTMPFIIMHLSRFDAAQKNSEALIPIAVSLQNRGILDQCRFRVFGQGERRSFCVQLAEEFGVSHAFSFEGRCPSSRKPLRGEDLPVPARAGCYLSTSRWEGLPLAILEALAEGVPVVASDVVGNRDAVAHGTTGFLFALDDAEDAADCIENLIKDPSMREELASNAATEATDRFSVQRMTREIESIYLSC